MMGKGLEEISNSIQLKYDNYNRIMDIYWNGW